ncbi:MAG: C4-type zinc ribbon domain-containing protein [Acidobacteriaceae bacterium]|jgi:predicted  nucleic acid-binding Zn-ribbon protein|nr:C4-type zinc ribbon domain-containing protein [Acidobacteriaceae bacterium]
MDADLERLIALQKLDSERHEAERRLAEEPDKITAIDATLESAKQVVADAKERLAENQNVRRAVEKDVAMHQGRLSKFREQAMAVKTNQEYHAIQHEIAFAQTEIKTLEDKLLEQMMSGDELATGVKAAEVALATAQKTAQSNKQALTAEHATLAASVESLNSQRATLVAAITPSTLAIFEMVAKRRHGVATAEAKDGICTICHVRLRPQVFNSVLRNNQILQCDSCQRILYFVPAPGAGAEPSTHPQV